MPAGFSQRRWKGSPRGRSPLPAQTALSAQAEAGQAARLKCRAPGRPGPERRGERLPDGGARAGERGRGVMNSYEATVTGAQGQVGTAQSESGQVERYKQSALGVLAPFLSEPAAQRSRSSTGLSHQSLMGLTSSCRPDHGQQARTKVKTAQDQVTAWEERGGVQGAWRQLTVWHRLPRRRRALRSSSCRKSQRRQDVRPSVPEQDRREPTNRRGDPGMGGAPPDRRGAAAAGQGYAQGAPAGKPPTAGALGR